MSLVGRKAPGFNAAAVINGKEIIKDFSLDQFIGKNYVVFFFWPKDFTFVCPTEIHAFQNKLDDFRQRDAMVVGASTDTEETHLAWMMIPREQGGIQGVNFPVIADTSKTIANNYGILGGDWNYNEQGELIFEGVPIAYRGTFLIDKMGIVRHETVNDFPLGRNIDETLRMLDALIHNEKYGEACPADWQKGKDTTKATRRGVADYLTKK